MSKNIVLDIRNYSIREIEELFDIKKDVNYTCREIELKELQVRQQIINSNIDKPSQEVITFTTTAKNWILTLLNCNIVQPNADKLRNITVNNRENNRENELTVKPNIQYVNTFNSEFFAGSLNPLNTRIITKCLAIDSKFRDNYYSSKSSDFMIQLPTRINKVVSMKLSAIEFPTTFYSISQQNGNNFFLINIGKNIPDASNNAVINYYSRIIIIPDGNYIASDLIAVINILLSPKQSGTTTLLDSTDPISYIELVLDVTENGSGSAKILVNLTPLGISSGIDIRDIQLDFSRNINGIVDAVDVSKKMGWILGFKNKFYSINNYLEGLLIKSESICETMKTRYIYLSIDDHARSINQQFISAYSKSPIDSNVLARVSFRGHSFYNLVSNDNMNLITEPRKYFGPVDLQTLHIRLYDEFGRIIDMNNSDFSFCLDLKLLYDL